jgi:phosphocarrier protein FPr/phosphocarrier protein
VDFFSIGTNDLTQYVLAMDRGHPQLAKQADALHPGVLAMIAMTCDGARAHGKWVGVWRSGVGRTLPHRCWSAWA